LGSGTYRRPDDRAAQLGASAAYVNRATIEAQLERPLHAGEWTAIDPELRPMACDERVSDAGTRRTDWIEDVLARASEPGRCQLSTPGSCPGDRSRP
jgi:hypothetical protein